MTTERGNDYSRFEHINAGSEDTNADSKDSDINEGMSIEGEEGEGQCELCERWQALQLLGDTWICERCYGDLQDVG